MDEELKIEDYSSEMLEPKMDDFIQNYFRRIPEICIWCPVFYVMLKIDSILSKGIFQYSKEYWSLRQNSIIQKKKAKQYKKEQVHSIKKSFQDFNNPRINSLLQTTNDGKDYVRKTISVKTNRKIQPKI